MKNEFVYIVGFPKSGNTWLTRLLARTLNAPVMPRLMRGALEIASDVNDLIDQNTKLRTGKVHFLPDSFLTQVDSQPKRVVYVYRDYRDILISAFFYFKPKYRHIRLRSLHPSDRQFYNPLNHWRLYRNRQTLYAFIKSYTLNGVPKNPDFGTWAEHIRQWEHFLHENPSIDATFVSYEALLTDTINEIKRIVDELNLSIPHDEDTLKTIIENESFSKKKAYFQETNNANIPKGEKHNKLFLRSGKNGDWRNYMNREMKNFVLHHNGEFLKRLGYLPKDYNYKNKKSSI